ncbi:hypothetical protein [Cupriavidus alkaliphilus]|uniref:hypothetical protein n=1 Tax=Cupriavidus alkaliphilus TaxID=942866 RepID=UPI00114C990A|nr:hypothetical protein [Cupriavidus alkaliphilus]
MHLLFRNTRAKYSEGVIVLKIRTDNGESAAFHDMWCTTDRNRVHAIARSNDFESDISVTSQYVSHHSKDYLIFFLASTDPREGQIFNLRDTALDERVGLITPINAIGSREHIWSEDEYFEAVAASVFWDLLSDTNGYSIDAPLTSAREYVISDFYDPCLSLLVVNPRAFPDFDIERYLPGLFSYGYSLYIPGRQVSSGFTFKTLPTGKDLRIPPVHDPYLGEGYLKNLYTAMLPYEQNSIAGFLLQYQVFEMLMQMIFTERLTGFKDAVNKFTGTASDLREILDQVQKLSAERDRIKASIDAAGVNAGLLKDLGIACKELLADSGKFLRSEQVSDLVYDVRNLIFHNYRSIPTGSLSKIEIINAELVSAMPRLLARPKQIKSV